MSVAFDPGLNFAHGFSNNNGLAENNVKNDSSALVRRHFESPWAIVLRGTSGESGSGTGAR
jgi:hypothetical protein